MLLGFFPTDFKNRTKKKMMAEVNHKTTASISFDATTLAPSLATVRPSCFRGEPFAPSQMEPSPTTHSTALCPTMPSLGRTLQRSPSRIDERRVGDATITPALQLGARTSEQFVSADGGGVPRPGWDSGLFELEETDQVRATGLFEFVADAADDGVGSDNTAPAEVVTQDTPLCTIITPNMYDHVPIAWSLAPAEELCTINGIIITPNMYDKEEKEDLKAERIGNTGNEDAVKEPILSRKKQSKRKRAPSSSSSSSSSAAAVKECRCGCKKSFHSSTMKSIQDMRKEHKYYFVIKTKFIKPAQTCIKKAIAHRDEWLASLKVARTKWKFHWNGPGTDAEKVAKLRRDELIMLLKSHGKSTNTTEHGRGLEMDASELREAWLECCKEERPVKKKRRRS